MRILHIGKYYPPFSGGIENFMAALLPELGRLGLRQAALVHQHRRGFPAQIEELDRVRVYRCPIRGRLVFAPLSPGFPAMLRRAIADFRPDVVHAHLPNASAFWALAPSLRCIPLVVHWHADVLASGFHAGLALGYRFYRPFERRLLARASAIVATSPAYRDFSPSLRPFLEKCHVVPLGLAEQTTVGVATQEPQTDTLWRAPGRFRILSVGRLTYYKGHECLIRAAAALEDVEVVIVGSGERRDALDTLVRALGAGESVRLCGHTSDAELQALLQSCDCLCLPSIERTEAFGLVLLEAMRAGKPCVVTDVAGSGMSWVVRDGETGLVTRSGSVDSLCNALARLRDAPELRVLMGGAGRERFREHFTIPAVAARLAELYEGVLAGGSSRTNRRDLSTMEAD